MKKLIILMMLALICFSAMAKDLISFGDYGSEITLGNPTIQIYRDSSSTDYASICYTEHGVFFEINGKELIRATEDGKFYINGELTKRNSTIYNAMLKWFEFIQYGR